MPENDIPNLALFSFTGEDDDGSRKALHRKGGSPVTRFDDELFQAGKADAPTQKVLPGALKKGDIVAIGNQWFRLTDGAVHRNGAWHTLF